MEPDSLTAFVVRGRGGGKTYAAVQWLKEDPDRRVIVTVDPARAVEIRTQYGLSTSQVMSCDGQMKPPPRLQGRPLAALELAIDDADELLRRAFLFKVAMVAAKGDCGHGADLPNPCPEPAVISGKTMAYAERMNPSSGCGACGERSYASFAYCPHCGAKSGRGGGS